MKLTKVQVTNYKCIDDSGEFSIRQMTCLAGKNEAGKSALLQALRRLNPVEQSESRFDDLMEYPRRRRGDVQTGGAAARVLDTEWTLDDDDVAAVERVLGKGAVGREIRIRRGYENRRNWSFQVNERSIIENLLSRSGELTASASERVVNCQTLQQLRDALEDEQSLSEGEQILLDNLNEAVPEEVDAVVRGILTTRLPKFLYFPTYSTLRGKISIERLRTIQHAPDQQEEHERVFIALLKLAGATVEQIADSSRYEEQKAQLESVSNNVSDEIFAYWSQNRNLQVKVDFHPGLPEDPPPFNTGGIIDLRVENTRHRVTVPFDERSSGFVWFFSFLVYFSQMSEMYGDNLIVLLDEPGLTLHGKAQGDLLRYMKERLLPRCQVIYTTHSPFMIDPDDLIGVRTVEDVINEDGSVVGTKVRASALSADSDTLLPLRGALGYDLTQSLFVGENSLLVEGSSDLLYLQWASRTLRAAGGEGLDPRWTITPVGGITKVAGFASLFGSNLLRLAVLVDFHHGDKQKVRDLEEIDVLSEGRVLNAAMFVEQKEADTEDMLGPELYAKLVNRAYELKKDRKFKPVPGVSDPLLNAVKEHFRTVAIEGPEFDHLTPAVYLVEHESEFANAAGVEDALLRFQAFFSKVNALLPEAER